LPADEGKSWTTVSVHVSFTAPAAETASASIRMDGTYPDRRGTFYRDGRCMICAHLRMHGEHEQMRQRTGPEYGKSVTRWARHRHHYSTLSKVMGSERMSRPVAWQTALAMAADTHYYSDLPKALGPGRAGPVRLTHEDHVDVRNIGVDGHQVVAQWTRQVTAARSVPRPA
jgi:hypothetical protein